MISQQHMGIIVETVLCARLCVPTLLCLHAIWGTALAAKRVGIQAQVTSGHCEKSNNLVIPKIHCMQVYQLGYTIQ